MVLGTPTTAIVELIPPTVGNRGKSGHTDPAYQPAKTYSELPGD